MIAPESGSRTPTVGIGLGCPGVTSALAFTTQSEGSPTPVALGERPMVTPASKVAGTMPPGPVGTPAGCSSPHATESTTAPVLSTSPTVPLSGARSNPLAACRTAPSISSRESKTTSS